MLITKVKVGKVTNLSEARYCAGMGVDFLSFPISSIDPKTYQEITGWVAGPKFGVEVESATLASVKEYKADFIEININQIDGSKGLENLIVSLQPAEWPEKKTNLLLSKPNILFLELQISSINDFVLRIIHDITEDFKILLKPSTSNQQPANGNWKLETLLPLPIDGLSFDGNEETKPGMKEYPLSEILERLEAIF
jgi:phosphoribosylanthranilate isomerase